MSDVSTPTAGAQAQPSSTDPKSTPIPTAPQPNTKAQATSNPGQAPAQPSEGAKPSDADLFEVIVDGEARQLTKEQAIRYIQKAQAADKRLKEGSQHIKKAQTFMQKVAENPAAALEEFGIDPQAFAHSLLAKQAEEALLTPEEKQRVEMERKLERYEREEQERATQEEERQRTELDQQTYAKLEQVFFEAAERNGLEAKPENLERIAAIGVECIQLGVPLTPDQLVQEVKDQEDAVFTKLEKKVLSGLKGEKLAQRLGPAVVQEILRWSVQKHRGAQTFQAKQPEEQQPDKVDSKDEYISERDFLSSLRKR